MKAGKRNKVVGLKLGVNLQAWVDELVDSATAIRNDCARVLGIAKRLKETDRDGQHLHRLTVIGGRSRSFVRAARRYLAAVAVCKEAASQK